MPTHDIIDNREQKLVDHINRILPSTEAARFAVGYFFVSGLDAIAPQLDGVRELRLLIGNTTNRETLEQIAEGYCQLELVAEAVEAQAYPKRTRVRDMAAQMSKWGDEITPGFVPGSPPPRSSGLRSGTGSRCLGPRSCGLNVPG
jgi:hypothetical protein